MDELKELLMEKIKVCASGITRGSSSDTDNKEAEAIEHLARAISYLDQIKEREVN